MFNHKNLPAVFVAFSLFLCGQLSAKSIVSAASGKQSKPGERFLYYIEDSYIKRGVCRPEIVPDPKMCEEMVPEQSKELSKWLVHTTGIYLSRYEKLIEKLSPSFSGISAKMIQFLENQNAKITERLKDADIGKVEKELIERQRVRNEGELVSLNSKDADRKLWYRLLSSPIAITMNDNAALAMNPVWAAGLIPLLKLTEAAFAQMELEEFKLNNWTCTAVCNFEEKSVYTSLGSHFSPYGGQLVDVGDKRYSFSGSYGVVHTGHQTEEAARAALTGSCNGSATNSGTLNWGERTHAWLGNRNPSYQTSRTETLVLLTCSLENPKPTYVPMKFPY